MQWMWVHGNNAVPVVALFRCKVSVPASGLLEFEYSADEGCQWFADGNYIGSGPELGAPERW